MNNVTLGNERVHLLRDDRRAARERAPTPPGPSAVHVAMSNTLNTPIEALEIEFPLRVDRVLAAARLRRRAGATAAATASCASSRRSQPMRFSLLTERRRHPPAGRRAAARPGAPGRNLLAAAAASPWQLAVQGGGRPAPGRPAADRDPGRRRPRAARRSRSTERQGSATAAGMSDR